MTLTHPTGRPLTEDEEARLVAAMPHPTMMPRLTQVQMDYLVSMTALRIFGDKALAELDAAKAHVDEITERLRKAELIKAEKKEGNNGTIKGS